MQAIILAAGMGKRLKQLTVNNTKCMVKVNGVSLIDRMLHQIDAHCLKRIIIVVGYKSDILIKYISTLSIKTPIVYVNNPDYATTNNIHSLALAKKELCEDDTILFESDLIFEDSVLDILLNDSRPSLALVDKYESWMDGTCVKLDEFDNIDEFIPGSKFRFEDSLFYYKTVNIYKFSKHFSVNTYVPFLNAYVKAVGNNEYYEQVLRIITLLDSAEIKAKRLSGQKWYEIDDIQDLDIASSIFAKTDDEMLDLMFKRYGGYWRYPHLIDFCYLVNPYYPPKHLVDEIKANFDKLLTQYPSGMGVNSLLAAKMFNVDQANIVIGNGAAELIKILIESLNGKIGLIEPSFQEYYNRTNQDNVFVYHSDNNNFKYTADNLMLFFEDKSISTLIVVNPENPTGNYIKKSDMLRLIQWCFDKSIKIIVDESFVDFSDELGGTLISQDILNRYPHLYVIKSISKSYGVPGLRLGILCSGDLNYIAYVKKAVSIWNINSFAEFYMQIEEKYKKDYFEAMKQFREERLWMYTALSDLGGIRVLPSQSNYFMIELTNGVKSKDVVKHLLVYDNILIKDLYPKVSLNYIRVAIRNHEDNQKLVSALNKMLRNV